MLHAMLHVMLHGDVAPEQQLTGPYSPFCKNVVKNTPPVKSTKGETKMDKKLFITMATGSFLLTAGMAQASLTTIGTAQFTNTGEQYNLIWDNVTKL